MPDDIRKGSPTEPPYFRQQRAWARQVNQELRTVGNRLGIRVGAGVNRERPIDWRHALDFRGEFANKAEYSDGTHDLVIAAGRVVKPTSVVTVAEATVATPVSGNLYVYLEVTLGTSTVTVQSASTLPDFVQDYNTVNIPIGLLTETTTGHWSWTQYHQGAVFLHGLDYTAEYGAGFWGNIEGETSGVYNGAVLDRDGSTDTTAAFSNASEVSGRLGIPTGSIVWIRPTDDQSGSDDYVFEYHGAPSGTLYSLGDGTISTPTTDGWDRASQGANRGVSLELGYRLFFDADTGEMHHHKIAHTADANGHEETWGSVTDTVIGIGTPSDETYHYLACADDSSVARFVLADKPAHDYCWVYDGTDMVKAYNDGLSAGAATSPVPCSLLMASAPANCAALDASPFEDDFNGTNGDSLNDCRWSRISSDGTAEIQSNELRISIAENTVGSSDGEEKWENSYVFTGDFDIEVTIDSTGLDQTTANGEFLRADLQLVGAGALFRALTIGAWPPDSGFLPSQFGYDFQQDGSPSSNNGATLAAGSHLFRFVRVGTALTGYINGNSFSFNSTSGDVQARIRVIGTGSSNPAISADFEDFTINSAD